MIHKLLIKGRLPGLNEYTKAQRSNKYKGAKFKSDAEESIAGAIYGQLRGVRITKPVFIQFLWVEKNRRRDKDNITAVGHKFILDALVKCGVLIDDGWKYIDGFSDRFRIDKYNPRIEVTIEEI